MAGRVLKIDVVVDENGTARRALTDVEGGIQNVEKWSKNAAPAVARLDAAFDAAEKKIQGFVDAEEAAERASQKHETQLAKTKGVLDDMTRAVVGYISFQAVMGAITSTAAWGSELEGLSRRLKVPVDDLQRLSFAAQQNGLNINNVASAMAMLEQRVGDDNSGAAGALNQIGINFQHIRQNDPLGLFMQIADGVSRVQDPFEQAQRVQAIFGREGNELIPLLTGHLRELMDQADKTGAVMDSGLAARAAAADTTIQNLTTRGKVMLAEFIDPLMTALTNLEHHDWNGLSNNLYNLLSKTPFGMTAGMEGHKDDPGLTDLFGDKNPPGLPLPPGAKKPQPAGWDSDPAGFMNRKTGGLSDELSRQEQILAKQLQYENDIARIEHEREHAAFLLSEDLRRALEASRTAFDAELSNAFMANLKAIKKETYDIRDAFVAMTVSQKQMSGSGISAAAQYGLDQKYQRQVETIDPRATNTAELTRRYQAERDLAIIETKKAAEGMTMAIADELNAFRIQYADIIGQLPIEFQGIVPDVTSASGELRDALTTDLDAVRSRTGQVIQGYTALGQAVRATKQDIADGLKRADQAYKDAGFFMQLDPNVTRLRGQQTGGILYAGGGLVEPAYLARGGPAGTDSVPAWLTPGEGVLSRTGMGALDRLNSGAAIGDRRGTLNITIEKGAIDARGAQFADDRSLDVLADKLQQKLAILAQRNGGA